jgi:lysozyme family protein
VRVAALAAAIALVLMQRVAADPTPSPLDDEESMASENYAPLFERVLEHEGGFSDDRRDPGNWTGGVVGKGVLKGTKYGIAANTFPNVDIRNLTKDQAREIYRGLYWNAIRGDQLPSGVDWAVFDFAINSGTVRAVMALQRALGLADDGRLGPVTLAAAYRVDPRKVIAAICDERLAFMRRLKHWKTYGKGWSRRVAETRALALSMTVAPPPTLFARLFGARAA